jgi:hypothetical protein
MDTIELKKLLLEKAKRGLADFDALLAELEALKSVLPFSEYDYIISRILAKDVISWEDYLEIRNTYVDANLYLYLYEMAPRTFGDTFGVSLIRQLCPELKKPSKEIHSLYNQEYDLVYQPGSSQFIRIEVKASRANDRKRKEDTLYLKAIATTSTRPFLMNFQQLKPSCCDIFIWIAVFRDDIRYWVIPSAVVQKHSALKSQHRREAKNSSGMIYEGQIMITEKNISEFDRYNVSSNKIIARIKDILTI